MHRHHQKIVGLCRNLLSVQGTLHGKPIRYVPVYARLQVEGCRLKLFHTDSLEAEKSHNILKNLHEACVEEDRDKLFKTLQEALRSRNFKPDRPVLLEKETEDYFSKFLFETPLRNLGFLTLRFLLRFGQKDSALEQKVLSKLLQSDIMEKNALDLATIRDCIELANTSLRWTLAKKCENIIKEGLLLNSFPKLVDSLLQHQANALSPYLLSACYSKVRSKREGVYPETWVDLLGYLETSGTSDHTMHKAVEHSFVKCSFKKFRYDVKNVRNILLFHSNCHTIHAQFLQILSNHLKLTLAAMTENNQANVSHLLSDCLISYTIIGFKDKELISFLIDILKNSEGQISDWNLVSAICELDYPCSDLFPAENLQKLMNAYSRKKKYQLILRTIIYENLLTLKDAESLLRSILGELNTVLKIGKYPFYALKAYFLLRAHIDIDLGAHRPFSEYERTLLEMLHQLTPGIEPSVRKKIVKFTIGQVLGDESLLRCFFWNEYGYFIDIEFYLDDEGNLRPQNYEGRLTRFVVVVLEEWDLIISPKEVGVPKIVDFIPRVVPRTLIRQLSKSENTEVITILYPQWNLLAERYKRQDFIRSEINARMEQRRKAETS